MSLHQYIKKYENVLSDNLCDDIINYTDLEKMNKATTGTGVLNEDRKCYTYPLEKKFEKEIFNIVGKVLKSYADTFEYFTTGSNTEDTGYQRLLYKGIEQGEYKMHVDHYDLNPRVLSMSFILNDNYNGGDFIFFKEKYKVTKQKGSAVVFPSNFCFPHAVTPVSNGDRHSIITWIR